MSEELYINDECVDLEPNAKITLNFKSNLLGDISKIVASNSQTIRLPKTTRNRRIMDNPSAVAYVSPFRYARYKARYVRNGIEVVRAAYAILLSSSECYEISVYWGVMTNFQSWIDAAGRLCDLAGEESVAWDKSTSAMLLAYMKSLGYGHAAYDCGVSDKNLTNIHPSVTAWWILNKISTQAGFMIEIPNRFKEELKGMAITCVSAIGNPDSTPGFSAGGFKLSNMGNLRFTWANLWDYVDRSGISDIIDGKAVFDVTALTQIRVVFAGNRMNNTRFEITGHEGGVADLTLLIYASNSTEIGLQSHILYKHGKGNIDNFDVVLDVQEYSYLAFGINGYDYYSVTQTTNMLYANISLYGKFDKVPVSYPSSFPFPIILNLPEITQVDFVKAMCGVLGLYVVPNPQNPNSLVFTSLDILRQNKENAFDWSSKLIKSNDDEPKTVEFKINDYCQRNIFKYAEDNTVATNANGVLLVDSALIDKEKTVLTLPFAASDGSKIPHYKLSNDGAKAEAVKVKDRIMTLIPERDNRAALKFVGLDFNTLIAENYTELSNLLNSALMITELFTLNECDLKTLDFTRPFYLRQYGKYYGIISIQTSGDKCEVKAVQLSENGRAAK